ncbi:hypothetical protein [Azohydromonas australica]|uniref:hypothetical protein n=1 Tax=Azohydromonas australica TaxID=364039 RepID=UPI0012EC7EC8|nr:hypothetical protein [Azohydromonas australica]
MALYEIAVGRSIRTDAGFMARARDQLRQRCGLLSLEGEIGSVTVIVWRFLREQRSRELMHSRLLAVYGVRQVRAKSVTPSHGGCTTSHHCWVGLASESQDFSDSASRVKRIPAVG